MKGKGEHWGRTFADDLAAHEDKREDNMQNTERGKLVCAVPRNESPIHTHAMLGTINIVWRIRRLRFEYALVRPCSAFNEARVQRRAKDVRLGTLRDSWAVKGPYKSDTSTPKTGKRAKQGRSVTERYLSS